MKYRRPKVGDVRLKGGGPGAKDPGLRVKFPGPWNPTGAQNKKYKRRKMQDFCSNSGLRFKISNFRSQFSVPRSQDRVSKNQDQVSGSVLRFQFSSSL